MDEVSINKTIGGFRGEGGKSPIPENEKIIVENGVISEGSLSSNKFSKNYNKIQFFNWIFIKNFQNFLKISEQFVFLVQKAKNERMGLLNLLKNMLK